MLRLYKFFILYSSFFILIVLSGLNPQQREAAEHTTGPLLVVAGAGSGKTRALTHRIAYLLSRGVPAWQILAVTFTNKAAGEMKERVHSLITESSEPPTVGTFHSIGVRILRSDFEALGRDRNFSILDADDALSKIKKILKNKGIDDKKFAPRAVFSRISLSKNNFISPTEYSAQADAPFEKVTAEVFSEYEKQKETENALDFDDLIVLPVVLFEKNPHVLKKYQNRWKYVSVDEFQDTNAVQLKFLDLLTREHRNLCAIGDSDQSIYAFRGADISNILNFQKLYDDAKVVKLEQNYRSTQNILDAADGVIKNNESRVPKKMWTESGAGELVEIMDCGDEREEAGIIAQTIGDMHYSHGKKYADFAILLRTNAQSRALEEAMMRNSIPYQMIGGLKFYSRKEIRDVLAYLKVIENPKDTESLLRIINLPPRKIGATTIARLMQYASDRSISMAEVIDHIDFAEGITPAAKIALGDFGGKIIQLRHLKNTISVAELISKIIEMFGLERFYRDGTEEGESRFENVRELQSVAHKFDSVSEDALSVFLQDVALIADIDNLETADRVTIMTLHASKGLEFPIVFIPACEEGILPHARSLLDPDQLEEERRLMYVGMTRAMEKLFLVRAKSRMAFGDFQRNPESRFLEEIPSACVYRPNGETGDTGLSEITYNTDEYNDVYISPFEMGDRVQHFKFGQGTVQEVQGDLATIQFDTAGKKKMSLSVAPLEKINE
jgi:DNA helicase-2/ATP-dependent DNA helicase PcrA